jgi:hypothetical protein
MSIKYYHASPYRIKVGTLLTPNLRGTNYEASEAYVYLTLSEMPHITVIDRALTEGWHIYEVRPHGQLSMGNWEDARCASATVVRYVGTARGLTRAQTSGNRSLWVGGEELPASPYKATGKGSKVDPRDLPRKSKGRGSYAASRRYTSDVLPSVENARRMMYNPDIPPQERLKLYERLGHKPPSWLKR